MQKWALILRDIQKIAVILWVIGVFTPQEIFRFNAVRIAFAADETSQSTSDREPRLLGFENDFEMSPAAGGGKKEEQFVLPADAARGRGRPDIEGTGKPHRIYRQSTSQSNPPIWVARQSNRGESESKWVATVQHKFVAAPQTDVPRIPPRRPRTKQTLAHFIDEIDTDRFDPANIFELYVGLPRLIEFEFEPKRVQIGDEKLATGTFIDTQEYSIVGLKLGSSVLNVWFVDDPDTPDIDESRRIHSYLIRVIPNPEFRKLLELEYKEIEDQINKAFPDSRIQLMLVGNRLILSGEARDVPEATYIYQLVQANTRSINRRRDSGQGDGSDQANYETIVGEANSYDPITDKSDREAPSSVTAFATPSGPARNDNSADSFIVNLLRVPGEQQVMLRVVVAEVNRSATRTVGLNFSVMNNAGNYLTTNISGGLIGSSLTKAGGGGGAGSSTGSANIGASLDNGQILLAINAMRTLGYARSLAEPNIVALNGQVARFQAGGQFPVPVISGFTAAGLQGVSFIPYGVIVQFIPTVTDRDRIRLVMRAEVSTRDVGSSTAIAGASVPSLSSRNFTTSVELREGQTLAVAGLIQTNLAGDSNQIPGIGDLPFIGNLFANKHIENAEQELVILITPEFVHPLDTRDGHEELALPGADLYEPGDLEFYLKGRLESRRATDYRSPVRSEWDRMMAYRHCEQQYIDGPHGQSLQWERPPHAESSAGSGAGMRYAQPLESPLSPEILPAPSMPPSPMTPLDPPPAPEYSTSNPNGLQTSRSRHSSAVLPARKLSTGSPDSTSAGFTTSTPNRFR